MTWEIAFTLGVLLLSVVLFATEKLRVDLVALLAMAILTVAGIVSPEEGFLGFSNPATITVAAMFVLSAGLIRTGALDRVAQLFSILARRNVAVATAALMLIIGPISAFINNTAAVAIFLPIVLSTARESGVSPSKLLIPLSFASMFGGVCTLIGTSTNILVSSIAAAHGAEPFGMFELAPLGLVMFAVGFVYMLTVGARLLPARRTTDADLTETFGMDAYLTELELLPESEWVGRSLAAAELGAGFHVDVLQIERAGTGGHHGLRVDLPGPDVVLAAGDLLRVRCDAEAIRELAGRPGVVLRPRRRWSDEILETGDVVLVEAVVVPGSRLVGSTLARARFRNVYRTTVLALRHLGETLHEELAHIPLSAGDTLLLELPRQRLDQLRQQRDFAVISQSELPELGRRRTVIAVGCIAAVVAAASTGLLPVAVAATGGALLLVLSRVLTLEEAYEAVDWKVIFLLAGVLTLGVALETTGAATLISNGLLGATGAFGPIALVATFYLLTSLLTEAMSNNATAAVLAPVAIVTAATLGVDSRPLLMAVTFAASASFMTPVGYQTNLLVYGPGQYRFSDFLKVGTPLNLLFWILSSLLIPVIWPF